MVLYYKEKAMKKKGALFPELGIIVAAKTKICVRSAWICVLKTFPLRLRVSAVAFHAVSRFISPSDRARR